MIRIIIMIIIIMMILVLPGDLLAHARDEALRVGEAREPVGLHDRA